MWKSLGKHERALPFLKSDFLCDEEYKDLCRITSERCEPGHIAVICAVYGERIQSVVFDEDQFNLLYPTMKTELASLLEEIADEAEKKEELDRFFNRYTNFECYKKNLFGEKI